MQQEIKKFAIQISLAKAFIGVGLSYAYSSTVAVTSPVTSSGYAS